MADGTVLDSRVINWRQVQAELVVKISMTIRSHEYGVLPGIGHKGFVTYRTKGYTWGKDHNGKEVKKTTNTWLIGWADEIFAHMLEADFQTGLIINRFNEPLKKIETHIHPRLKQQWKREWDERVRKRELEFGLAQGIPI